MWSCKNKTQYCTFLLIRTSVSGVYRRKNLRQEKVTRWPRKKKNKVETVIISQWTQVHLFTHSTHIPSKGSKQMHWAIDAKKKMKQAKKAVRSCHEETKHHHSQHTFSLPTTTLPRKLWYSCKRYLNITHSARRAKSRKRNTNGSTLHFLVSFNLFPPSRCP